MRRVIVSLMLAAILSASLGTALADGFVFRQTGGWVKDFELTEDRCTVTIDFSEYAKTHTGTYHVLMMYPTNRYSFNEIIEEGATLCIARILPEMQAVFGIYCDVDGSGVQTVDQEALRVVTGSKAVAYADHHFVRAEKSASLQTADGVVEVKAFSVDDVKDPDAVPMAVFKWEYESEEEIPFNVIGSLVSPSGQVFIDNFSFTLAADGSGTYVARSLRDVLDRCSSLEELQTGEYMYAMFQQDQLIDTLTFSIGEERILAEQQRF